ncbi:MAG: hypothetical protein SVU32_04200, partial [Candidatus Nanohaloarchaea archaeon]|nr:hypothetical protein [Candidatus Nanohaloarchaea archaeon]
MSRAAGNSITISWTNQSDIEDGVEVQYREDSGSGYGAWTTATTTAAGATSYSTSSLPNDVRRQYRIRTVAPDGGTSTWVYPDYGNNGNVFFTADFEDNDLAEWDSKNFSDSNSGVTSNMADQGTYSLRLDASDYVRKSLGDLSGVSDGIVKAAVRVESQDTNGEFLDIRWYDGSTWNDLQTYGWAYNRQGWVEMGARVPSSWLSTDNRLQIGGDAGGGGDKHWVDRVVVSDVLHEYTAPAAPSSLSLETSTE